MSEMNAERLNIQLVKELKAENEKLIKQMVRCYKLLTGVSGVLQGEGYTSISAQCLDECYKIKGLVNERLPSK